MIDHLKEPREQSCNFWTSSFKKLLLQTEDDKKLRVISKILRKALGGLDSEKVQHKRCGSFPKEKFRRRNNVRRSLILNQQSTPKKVSFSENNITTDIYDYPSETGADLYNAHIYETIKLSRPEMIDINKNNKNERNNLLNTFFTCATPNQRDADNKVNIQPISQQDILESIPDRVPITVANKIALFEQLSQSNEYSSIETLCHELDQFFADEYGKSPSPIPKFKGRSDVEKKFVVNCYESRPRVGGYEVIKPKMGSGDIVIISDDTESDYPLYANICADEEDKCTLEESVVNLVRKRPRRVIQRPIFEAMEEIELLNGMDLITELHKRATLLEMQQQNQLYSNTESSVQYNNEEEPLYATPNKNYKKTNPKSELEADKNNNNDVFFKLKQEADIQCKVMKQAAKALEVYRGGSCRGFFDARSEVEAEKILLTASCKYELLLQEIRHIHYEQPHRSTNVGSVILRDFTLDLIPRREVEWFVCIVSDEENVVCSKAIEVQPTSNVLIFDEVFSFDNLDAGFKLKAEIFSFKQSFNRKRKSNKLNKKVHKLSRKLLYKDLQTYSLVESHIPETSFVREGSINLTVSEITSQTKDWRMELQPESQLTGKCDLEAHIMNVELDVEKSGFLTIGSENYFGINWNRRWCVLRGTMLNYWNYPNEDCNPPLGAIDLRNCKCEVTNAKRSFCPKPKTLLLESIGDEVHFLNADSISDMHDWRNKLNKAYLALKGWNMLRIQVGTDV